ncbi:MAG: hypothetical protein L6Q92_14705 [Phycisphaerae bacterium]|nr:hypothetical protein [Phycisphaerae bacterium]
MRQSRAGLSRPDDRAHRPGRIADDAELLCPGDARPVEDLAAEFDAAAHAAIKVVGLYMN